MRDRQNYKKEYELRDNSAPDRERKNNIYKALYSKPVL